jgi:protein gp37
MGLLTKDRLRISRTDTWPIKNLWLGVTTETQEQADKRIPLLLQIPAAVYLITHEPALGAITYPPEFLALGNRAWLINGGESGAGARPMHPDIPRHDRDQCQAAGVPFFFKGWGEFIGIDYHPEECPPGYDGWRCADGQFHDEIKTKPNGSRSIRVGKKAAGRLLDGRTWEEYPK